MSYSGYGALAAIGLVAVISGFTAVDRSSNYQPAKATVYMIDRTCNFIETTTSADGRKTARGMTDLCSSSEEWAEVRTKRNKVVSGKAIVHLNYVAPQDGSSRTAKLQYDGRADQFYALKAGDMIDVLVSNDDPSKVIED